MDNMLSKLCITTIATQANSQQEKINSLKKVLSRVSDTCKDYFKWNLVLKQSGINIDIQQSSVYTQGIGHAHVHHKMLPHSLLAS